MKRFFILFMALMFLINSPAGNLMVEDLWAARTSSGLTSVGPEKEGSPAPLKTLGADTFTLPQEFGYVQEAVKAAAPGKTVIHIQDAHCNYAAQKSIAELLDYLTKEYGINIVNCEGGLEDYDLSVFTDIPEKDIREKTADHFVKEGVVSAAEYFAVNNPEKVKLWGVEDADLYIKNLKIYRDSLAYKAEADRFIKSIDHILSNLKRHMYSKDLMEFDTHYIKYKDGKVAFREYLAYLTAAAKKRLIDIKAFPDIYILSQTLAEEDRIDFKRANSEKDEVVNKLKKFLSKNELAELVEKSARLKAERISQADFYSYLMKKARSVNLDVSEYTELGKYTLYVSLYSTVDRTKVAGEMGELENRIRESLYENDAQRELGALSKNLALTKNIFNISLTRDDYAYYRKNEDAFATANYERFIAAYAPVYRIQASPDKNIGMLDQYRERMCRFYECSLERDKAFIKNIRFTDQDRPNSIIITGGFHTANLRELFKDKNVSYISIMPKFKNEPGYENPYLKRLAGQRTALENVIDTAIPAVLNLQVVEILSRLGIMVVGRAGIEHFDLVVAITAAAMRNQPFVLKLSKGLVIEKRRLEEDKVIVFARGEGGNITYSVESASGRAFDAELTGLEPFAVRIIRDASEIKAEAPPRAPAQRAEPQRPAEEFGYADAVKPATGMMAEVKKISSTRIISPVAEDEDMAVAASYGPITRKLLGPEIHTSTYLAKGDWMKELQKLLEAELPEFAKEVDTKFAPRMLIKVIYEEGRDNRQEIRNFTEKFLTEGLKYPAKTVKEIMDRIRFVHVQLVPDRRTNSALELFADAGMMECDRYLKGDYEKEPLPPELENNFLALLKLSILNWAAFEGKNINDLLQAIFAGTALKIRPRDFKSVDEWKRANQRLLESV